MKRVRPTTPLDFVVGVIYAISAAMIALSVLVFDWWSINYTPTGEGGLIYTGDSPVGTSLDEVYPVVAWLMIGLAFLGGPAVGARFGPRAFLEGWIYLPVTVLSGIAGLILTVVAAQLGEGALSDAWMATIGGWILYFGALLLVLVTRDPELESQTRPGSSDG